jgi:hypothetical protein
VGQELGATETSNAGQSSGGATAGQATENAAGIPTNVLGRSITRKAPSAGATAGAASLPFTGAEIGALAAAAALALGGGTALTVVGRRRRQNRSVS